jgi:hypothetical protein
MVYNFQRYWVFGLYPSSWYRTMDEVQNSSNSECICYSTYRTWCQFTADANLLMLKTSTNAETIYRLTQFIKLYLIKYYQSNNFFQKEVSD